jgi:hypothetical protein
LSNHVSHSKQKPGNLRNAENNAKILKELRETPSISRLAGFASNVFANWAPKLFKYYSDNLEALCDHHPELERNFSNSVWTTATFNFGPRTTCYPHKDAANLAYGFCAITALGQYNPKMGGHLVLWDVGLAIEFSPGSTILIPSALLRHSNTSLPEGHQRMSFTQYTPGGLFRWVDYRFRTEEQFSAQDPRGMREFKQNSENRWKDGLGLFSTLKDF